MTTTPNQSIRRGNLFITPVAPAIAEVPYPAQSFTKPPDFSLWVHGEIQEDPGLHLDRARMSTSLYREVRDDLTRYSPVEVTRSAIRRSSHAYVGVIDSRGVPYYFALDSRGVSVREAPPDAAWKAFDKISGEEHMTAVRQRRAESAGEMRRVDRELSEPTPLFVAAKSIKYGKKADWKNEVPHSSWWRNTRNTEDSSSAAGQAKTKTRRRKRAPRTKQPASKTPPASPPAPSTPSVPTPKRTSTSKPAKKQKQLPAAAPTSTVKTKAKIKTPKSSKQRLVVTRTKQTKTSKTSKTPKSSKTPKAANHKPTKLSKQPSTKLSKQPKSTKTPKLSKLPSSKLSKQPSTKLSKQPKPTKTPKLVKQLASIKEMLKAAASAHGGDLFVAAAQAHQQSRTRRTKETHDRALANHERHGGVVVGHTRIRPSGNNEAKPGTAVTHYVDNPDHVIGGPGHRIEGEPEKPRGTTATWRPGDEERRRNPPARAEKKGRMRYKRERYGKSVPLVLVSDHAAEYRRVGHELWLQGNDDESELDPPRPEDAPFVAKALPRKSKEKETKKTPSRKAVKKQAGSTGKTRYTYPQEKNGGAKAGATKPLIVVHDDHKHADPVELANQLGVSMRTLRRAATKLGSDGFSTFMRSRLKAFAMKHRLDPDYWGTLYATLMAGSPLAKSDHEKWKHFGDAVNRVASAVPKDHSERFGDRKVFIHHVHSEMKRHGKYDGDLDSFKRDLVHAHHQQHVTLSRADLVSAMHPHSVEQSETKADGAHFHFVSDVKHDPEAARGLAITSRRPAKMSEEKAGRPGAHSLKKPAGPGHDAATAASIAASGASAHAKKKGSQEAHLAAMTAHHQAGVAHQKASGNHNDKTALQHFDVSMSHLKQAKAAKV